MFGECRAAVFADTDDPETAVLGVHVYRDPVQPLLVLAEHFGDVGDREDVSDASHGQAARLIAVPAGRQFHGSKSSTLEAG